MTSRRGHNSRSVTMPMGIGFGIVVSVCVTIAGAMILAWLISGERAGEDVVGWGCMIIQLVASMAGSVTAWKSIKHSRLPVTAISALGYYLVLIAVGLAFGSGFSGMGITALMVGCGGGIALIPAFISGSSGVRRHKILAPR